MGNKYVRPYVNNIVDYTRFVSGAIINSHTCNVTRLSIYW